MVFGLHVEASIKRFFLFLLLYFVADGSAESNAEHDGDSMEEFIAKIAQARRESEENRKYWAQELRSMNKWEKYGLG